MYNQFVPVCISTSDFWN